MATHKVGGLSKNDFILAAKVDKHPPHVELADAGMPNHYPLSMRFRISMHSDAS